MQNTQEINIYTETSEHVDTVGFDPDALHWAVGVVSNILYGDLSYYEGPRIVQIPMNEDDLIARVQYEIDINNDCFGTEDSIELVLV